MHLFWNNIAPLEKKPSYLIKFPQKWINFFRLNFLLKFLLKFLKKKLYRFWRKKIIFTLLDLTTSYISLNDSNDNCELFFELSVVRNGRSGYWESRTPLMSGWRCSPSGCIWSLSSPQRTSCSRCRRRAGCSRSWTRTGRMWWDTPPRNPRFVTILKAVNNCSIILPYPLYF